MSASATQGGHKKKPQDENTYGNRAAINKADLMEPGQMTSASTSYIKHL